MGDIEAHESRLYSDFAPLYDKIFGKIFYSRLEHVIEDLEIPAARKFWKSVREPVRRFLPTRRIAMSRALIWPPTCWPGRVKKSMKTVGRI